MTRRAQIRRLNQLPEETRSLQDGDPVHVIGTAEIYRQAAPDAVDAGLLVVRPSSEKRHALWWERILFPDAILSSIVHGQAYRHMFFLTDSDEVSVTELLERSRTRSVAYMVIWVALSAWLAASGWR